MHLTSLDDRHLRPIDDRLVVQWRDLDVVASVVIVAKGWRLARVPGFWSADDSGEQTIQIRFHYRTPVRRLRVVSSEHQSELPIAAA